MISKAGSHSSVIQHEWSVIRPELDFDVVNIANELIKKLEGIINTRPTSREVLRSGINTRVGTDKGRTHREYRRKLSSKYNRSILAERHHLPLSKVYGVPTEG